MNINMVSLSITLPDDVARASNEVAKKLGISRTVFIRQAIVHELNDLQARFEQDDIIKSFNAMKKSEKYLEEIGKITDTLNSELPNEKEKWWIKEKY